MQNMGVSTRLFGLFDGVDGGAWVWSLIGFVMLSPRKLKM